MSGRVTSGGTAGATTGEWNGGEQLEAIEPLEKVTFMTYTALRSQPDCHYTAPF